MIHCGKGGKQMVFRDETYSVLLVSASEKVNTALKKLLPVSAFWPVDVLGSVHAALRRVSEHPYDLVIINAPLPDDDAIRLSTEISTHSDSGILLLIPADLYEAACSRTEDYGVLTIRKPVTEQMLSQCLHLISAVRNRMKLMMEKQATVEEKIEEIRLINHAKWQLIEQKGMTEPEAHKYLEKYAMDERIPKREAAEWILNNLLSGQ